jgi:hypothetical protein
VVVAHRWAGVQGSPRTLSFVIAQKERERAERARMRGGGGDDNGQRSDGQSYGDSYDSI